MIKNKTVKFILNGVFLTLCIPLILGIVLFCFILEYKTHYDFKDVVLFTTCSVVILTFILHTVNGEKDNLSKSQSLIDSKDFQTKQLINIKQQNSYNVISHFANPEMVEPLRAYRDIKKEIPKLVTKSNVEPLKKYLEQNPKDHSRLHLLLNFLESVSLQVNNDFLDESIIKDAFHSMFYNVYTTMKSYIKDAQSEKGYEKVWEEFERMSKKWGEPK